MPVFGSIIIGIGLVFMAFGILGSIILPDLLTRSHAATKCGITGSVTILAGLAAYTLQWDFSLKLLFIIVFTFLTGPIIAHVIAVGHLRRRAGRERE